MALFPTTWRKFALAATLNRPRLPGPSLELRTNTCKFLRLVPNESDENPKGFPLATNFPAGQSAMPHHKLLKIIRLYSYYHWHPDCIASARLYDAVWLWGFY
jgi:hypothetical protein